PGARPDPEARVVHCAPVAVAAGRADLRHRRRDIPRATGIRPECAPPAAPGRRRTRTVRPLLCVQHRRARQTRNEAPLAEPARARHRRAPALMAHSLAGIFLAQALFLVVGLAMLWTLRGWPTATELVRLGAFAYVVGVAVIGVEATLVLVAGGGLGLATILGVSAATVAVCVAIALGLRRPLPRRFGLQRPRLDPGS